MAITVDIGPGGRQLLSTKSGRPLLGLDHKYFKNIFGDLLADIELDGEGDEIHRVRYSLVRHGKDLLDDDTPMLGKGGGIGDQDHQRLKEAYSELDRQRQSAANAQVRAILNGFYVTGHKIDPFAFRIYRDPIDNRKRLAILWGTAPGTVPETELIPPDNKHNDERDMLLRVGGWTAKFRQSPWMQYSAWVAAAAICMLIFLLFLRANCAPIEDPLVEPSGDSLNTAAALVDSDSVLVVEGGERGFWGKMKHKTRYFIFGEPDTVEVAVDTTVAILGTPGAAGTDSSGVAGGEGSDAAGTDSSDAVGGEGSGAAGMDSSDAAGGEGSDAAGTDKGEQGQKPPGSTDSLPGGELYVAFPDGGAGNVMTVVRVVLSNPPRFEFLRPESLSQEIMQSIVSMDDGLVTALPGMHLQSIWVPDSDELLNQVDVNSLTGDVVPSRLPHASPSRSEVNFIRLLVNDQGRLIGKTPISVNTWDR